MAATQYEVLEATPTKDLPATSQRGPLRVWDLKLRDEHGEVHTCQRLKKPGNDLALGQSVFGYLEPNGNYPAKLKEVEPPDIPGVQKGVEGVTPKTENKYERQPDHPLNVARARHTSAMSKAPDYYQLFREEGLLPKPDSQDRMKLNLVGVMTWLESTYPDDPRVDS